MPRCGVQHLKMPSELLRSAINTTKGPNRTEWIFFHDINMWCRLAGSACPAWRRASSAPACARTPRPRRARRTPPPRTTRRGTSYKGYGTSLLVLRTSTMYHFLIRLIYDPIIHILMLHSRILRSHVSWSQAVYYRVVPWSESRAAVSAAFNFPD